MRDWIISIALVAVGVAIGYLAWGRSPVGAGSDVDTLYVERTIRERDTSTVDRPETRVIYERHTDTVRVEVPVPVWLVGAVSSALRRSATKAATCDSPCGARARPGGRRASRP